MHQISFALQQGICLYSYQNTKIAKFVDEKQHKVDGGYIHLKERLNLFSKFSYSFFVFCFVFEIFRRKTVRLSAILNLFYLINMTSQQG